jgi:hypothetical protein
MLAALLMPTDMVPVPAVPAFTFAPDREFPTNGWIVADGVLKLISPTARPAGQDIVQVWVATVTN